MNDTAAFKDLLARRAGFFASSGEIFLSRAPGRLDLMGGIADYSGALVLQWPIAEATHAAAQLRDDKMLRLLSLHSGTELSWETPLGDFIALDYAAARTFFQNQPENHWAAYVAGAWLVLAREKGVVFACGANALIHSDVPLGKGVSSSASLEVAVMQAVAAAYEVVLTPPEIAVLCQKVENLVAGAPCGVMDQMAVACGEAGKLLKLLCQPAELLGATQLPEELGVWGIDSGVRHAVTGADYGTVRTAAFIGYRIIAEVEGLACETVAPGRVRIEDARWRGYLANIAPAEFAESYAAHLPELMSGAEFLQRYGGITDMVTAVNPERSYPVYQATRHPVEENARVVEFAALLADWRGGKQAERLGRLMYESHESYSACGLGAMATDAIVRLARDTPGLYGAKITGGGSGGTVAVLGRCDAAAAVAEVAAKYAEQSGYAPFVLAGSSAGARRVF